MKTDLHISEKIKVLELATNNKLVSTPTEIVDIYEKYMKALTEDKEPILCDRCKRPVKIID